MGGERRAQMQRIIIIRVEKDDAIALGYCNIGRRKQWHRRLYSLLPAFIVVIKSIGRWSSKEARVHKMVRF